MLTVAFGDRLADSGSERGVGELLNCSDLFRQSYCVSRGKAHARTHVCTHAHTHVIYIYYIYIYNIYIYNFMLYK